MAATALLQVRVTSAVKSRFATLAEKRGMNESLVLRLLVDNLLASQEGGGPVVVNSRVAGPRDERITVRLLAGDLGSLVQRAHARGLRPATYIVALVRSHLRSVAPLPTAELEALMRSVSELSTVGRNLNQIARAANVGNVLEAATRVSLRAVLTACEALRAHTKILIKANLASWQDNYGQTHR